MKFTLYLTIHFCVFCIDVNSSIISNSDFLESKHDDIASRRKREIRISDSIACVRSQSIIEEKLIQMDSQTRKLLTEEIELTGDNKFSLQMTWIGDNPQKIIVITSEGEMSTCYISDDSGIKFNNISSRFIDAAGVANELSLQKHPLDPNTVYVVATAQSATISYLHISRDAGGTFQKIHLPFIVTESFVYHPSDPRLILAADLSLEEMFISKDFGFTWSKIKSDVTSFKWSTVQASTDIFALTSSGYFSIYADIQNNELVKSSDFGNTWSQILEHVYTFGVGSKFLYASVYVSESSSDQRKLMVSTDSGLTWNHARLPAITPDRFYSILDSSEGQIFLHVDEPGNTGKGTLFLSDATGIIFSKSLENHLYPNYEDLTDFYPVQSLRGVYIASQLLADNSIQTVISYNRGGEWQPLKRPTDIPCADENKICHLQIHNLYSIKRGIRANPPLSVSNAVGIILVHGHVAESLQTTDPDVYVSQDGGYTWKFALKGPHHYQIADHGGLLVAVPADTDTPNVIKFSTDEGGCWITYNFTQHNQLHFTGLLVEPGNKKMTAAVWGYTNDHIWHTYIINFTVLVDRKCSESSDYEEWTAHIHNGDEGCLFGSKETFKRLKTDSWCYNGEVYVVTRNATSCLCTRDDYYCDFGYVRQPGGEDCIIDPEVNHLLVDICKHGHEEKMVPLGYHKIPGDVCRNGFVPKDTDIIDMSEKCFKFIEHNDTYFREVNHGRSLVPILTVSIVICGLIFIVVVMTISARKYRKHASFHYMSIKADEDQSTDIRSSENFS